MIKLVTFALVSAIALAVAAYGDHDHSRGHHHHDDSGNVKVISTPWIRTPLPGRDISAGYISLRADEFATALIGARSDEAEQIELHTMTMVESRMRMRRVESFAIEQGGTMELAPGGDHFMIFGLTDDAMDDNHFDMTLIFDGGQTLDVTFEVSDFVPEGE